MSNTVAHAKRELELAGFFNKDGIYGGLIGEAVLDLVEKFASQGHSGMSANIVIDLFSKVAKFEPISPITGSDDEWSQVSDDHYQNNRLPSVFKSGKNGKPYYLDAIVWREGRSTFTGTVGNITSRQFIKLPFLPKKFYVDVDANRNIIDKSQLEKAFEYYHQ